MDGKTAFLSSKKHRAALKIAGFLAVELAAVLLVYYWRVFYHLDARGIPALGLTALCGGVLGVVYLLALLAFCQKDFARRAAAWVLLAGLVFCFADPPMQVPDETSHFLRSWRISEGCFVFDAKNTYPEDVSRLMQAFPGAWVTAHTSQGVHPTEPGAPAPKTDPVLPSGADPDVYTTGEGWSAYTTGGYGLKQYGEAGLVQSVKDGFALYFSGAPAAPVKEPLNFAVFPYLAAALGIALARLVGFGALGCFYAGRIANLLIYTLLCWAALKRLHKMRPVFLVLMLLPMSLFMAASYNYDAIVLGCCYLLGTFFFQKKWENRDAAVFCAAFLVLNTIKPWINLLWLGVLLFADRRQWKAKLRPWQLALVCLAGAVAVSRFVDWYGSAFRYNYGTIGRQLGETVNQVEQLKFILANPLRYIAVLVGTLYENDFYLGQLGLFGAMDLPLTVVNLISPLMLLLGAVLAVPKKQKDSPWHGAGLFVWGLVYLAGSLTAMYITWTPVGMVRVVGFQARYLLPTFLVWAAAASQALGSAVTLRTTPEKAEHTALFFGGGFALLTAVLLFQHMLIGPVFTM